MNANFSRHRDRYADTKITETYFEIKCSESPKADAGDNFLPNCSSPVVWFWICHAEPLSTIDCSLFSPWTIHESTLIYHLVACKLMTTNPAASRTPTAYGQAMQLAQNMWLCWKVARLKGVSGSARWAGEHGGCNMVQPIRVSFASQRTPVILRKRVACGGHTEYMDPSLHFKF